MAKKPKATGECATCPFWKKKASKIKGKLIPGGTGKCTRPEGLCDNPKPKDPHPGWKGKPEKEEGLREQAPDATPQASQDPSSEVLLTLIYPNPDQPRKFFSKEALEELALSIKEQGLIEPLVVVKRGERFMLVAGERRWRAAHIAGLAKVPVRVLEADDQKVAEMARERYVDIPLEAEDQSSHWTKISADEAHRLFQGNVSEGPLTSLVCIWQEEVGG